MYYGMRNNDDQLINNAFMLLLQKLWNGRKYVYIKYCDKRIMNYVVNHMVNKKHNVANYDTPLALIKDYFVPTILNKYRPEILKDVNRLKQLFMQSWARIDQMFAFNPVVDMQTGLKRAQGGLLPMYMKAKQEGLYQSTPTIMTSDESEDDASFDQYSTLHNRDSIISSTTDYIVMNSKPQYNLNFINEINRNTKVSSKIISQILTAVHNHNYYDLIRDSLTIVLSRTKVSDKTDIYKPTFSLNVKRNVISSKNTEEIRKLQTILGMLSEKIFKDSLNIDYNKYGKAQQIQIQNVILFCLIHNLQRYNCK
jgi:anaerobic ribonucleoside-triphosphate reductase